MSSAATRMARLRERTKLGLAVLPVEVDLYEVADALVEARLIGAWDAENRDVIKAGLEQVIETWLLERSGKGI